jgi:hypothetical protein
MSIVIGIGVLVVAALALFYMRQGKEDYTDGTTPQSVVHNYALAIYRHDYQYAYGLVADLPGKPTYTQFRQSFLNDTETARRGLEVGDVISQTGTEAMVGVRMTYNRGDLFSSSAWQNDTASLEFQGSRWKITLMPYPYWQWGWMQSTPVKISAP